MAALVAVLARSSPASAYRPFDGTDADVAGRGEFELELGPSHFYRLARKNYLIAPATVLNLGILPQTELVVDFNDFVALNPDPDGPRVRLLDTDVLLKHVFREGVLQGRSGVSVAVEAGPLLPEINGTNAFGASADCIVSYQWPALTLHFNEWAEYTRAHNPFVFTGLIAEGPHEWAVRPVAEVFYSHEWNARDEASALVGAIWALRESFTLDAGVRGARLDGQDALEVRLGFTLAIPVWHTADNGDALHGSVTDQRD
ncbi:MAG TPA: hypothetical protein VHC69_00775 [Polyangiaceae bacterium]|nr:hypothetical protein [Polyangiaceae bacterium]